MDGWNKNIAPATAQPNVFGYPDFPTAQAVTQKLDRYAPASTEYAGRATLQWTPTPDFDAIFRFTADVAHENDAGGNVIVYCPHGGTQENVYGYSDPGRPCNLNSETRSVAGLPAIFAQNYPYANGGIPFYESKNYLASLVLNKKFDWGDVTSTTGYVQEIVSDAAVDDDSRYALVYDAEHENYKLFTQEIRANTDLKGPLNFTAGAYFEHFTRPHFNAPFLGYEGFDPDAQNYTNNEQTIANRGDTYSVFGQARWKILDNLELAGGARWTHDTKSATFDQLSVNPGNILGPLHPVGDPFGTKYRGSNVSPEVTLTWHPAREQMLYAAYKTGYKSGGIANTAVIAATTPASALRFGPEKSQGFEIGYKGELFDRKLRLALTAYRYNYR
jgi:outer membrane receptor protein involved in Fe transport